MVLCLSDIFISLYPPYFLIFFSFLFLTVHFVKFLRTHPFSIYFLKNVLISNVMISNCYAGGGHWRNTVHIFLEHAVLYSVYSMLKHEKREELSSASLNLRS